MSTYTDQLLLYNIKTHVMYKHVCDVLAWGNYLTYAKLLGTVLVDSILCYPIAPPVGQWCYNGCTCC